jgi:hypothetical protein
VGQRWDTLVADTYARARARRPLAPSRLARRLIPGLRLFALALPGAAVVWGETASGPVFYVPRGLSPWARERAIADALADWVLLHTHAGRPPAAAAVGALGAALTAAGPHLQRRPPAPPAPARAARLT